MAKNSELVPYPTEGVEKYIESGSMNIDRDEAMRLFFLYARSQKFVSKLGSGKEALIARCALNFVVIIDEACRIEGDSTEELKTYEQCVVFLRRVLGLKGVRDWIEQSVEARMKYVEQSGDKTTFYELYNFTPGQKFLSLNNLVSFRSSVSDIESWFMFNEYMERNLSPSAIETLFSNKRTGTNRATPNKRLAFFSFITSLYLGTELRPFALRELKEMVSVLREDYEQWLSNLMENVQKLTDSSMAVRMINHGTMRSILETLKEKKLRTVHQFARDLRLTTGDEEIFKHMDLTVSGAVRLISQHRLRDLLPGSEDNELSRVAECNKSLNQNFMGLHPSRAAELFFHNQWLAPNLEPETLERLWISSLGNFPENLRILEGHFKKADLQRLKIYLGRSFSVEEVIQSLWGIKDLEGFDVRQRLLGSTLQYRDYKPIRWNETSTRSYTTRLMKRSLANLPIQELGRQIIFAYEHSGYKFSHPFLSDKVWLALVLLHGRSLPEYVHDYVRSYDWYELISDEASIAWINDSIYQDIVKNARNHIFDETSIQEVLRQVQGFAVSEF